MKTTRFVNDVSQIPVGTRVFVSGQKSKEWTVAESRDRDTLLERVSDDCDSDKEYLLAFQRELVLARPRVIEE